MRRVENGLLAADNAPDAGSWAETWEVLATNLRDRAGAELTLAAWLTARVVAARGHGAYVVTFVGREGTGVLAASERLGRIPLPPYIEAARRREQNRPGEDVTTPEDETRYQTVYAASPGAVAAPTAGLHFTQPLLDEVRARGHDVATLTLHVGPGTFRPVEADDPRLHRMETESYEIPAATVAKIASARADRRPIVAVGTTAVRALEAAARGGFAPGPQRTELFLLPGAEFQVVTDLVTNFHLPRSTLLMLVAAFAGREPVLRAYAEAVARGYRFYSYGDAMFISPGVAGR